MRKYVRERVRKRVMCEGLLGSAVKCENEVLESVFCGVEDVIVWFHRY